MDLGLNGKVALVAAASKGLGRATAEELAREGARVVICARGAEALMVTRDAIARETGADIHAGLALLRSAPWIASNASGAGCRTRPAPRPA